MIYNEFDIFAGNVKMKMCLPIEKERSRSIIAIVPETRLQICKLFFVDVDLQVGISKDDHSNANDDLEEGERKLTPAHLKA